MKETRLESKYKRVYGTFGNIQYNTLNYSAALNVYNIILYNTVQNCTILYNNVQYCTIVHNTVQYCTIMYTLIKYFTLSDKYREI